VISEKRIVDDIKQSEVLPPHLAVSAIFFYDKALVVLSVFWAMYLSPSHIVWIDAVFEIGIRLK